MHKKSNALLFCNKTWASICCCRMCFENYLVQASSMHGRRTTLGEYLFTQTVMKKTENNFTFSLGKDWRSQKKKGFSFVSQTLVRYQLWLWNLEASLMKICSCLCNQFIFVICLACAWSCEIVLEISFRLKTEKESGM